MTPPYPEFEDDITLVCVALFLHLQEKAGDDDGERRLEVFLRRIHPRRVAEAMNRLSRMVKLGDTERLDRLEMESNALFVEDPIVP